MTRTSSVVTLEVAKQGAIYHGLATLLNQPSPMMQRSKGGRRGRLLHGLRLPAVGRAASVNLFQNSQTLRSRPCCVHCPDSREGRGDEHPRARCLGSQAHGFPGPRLGVASRSSDMVLIWPQLHRPGDCGDPSVPHASTQGAPPVVRGGMTFQLTGSHRL